MFNGAIENLIAVVKWLAYETGYSKSMPYPLTSPREPEMSLVLSESDIAHYDKLFPDDMKKVREALDKAKIDQTVPALYYGLDYSLGLITVEEYREWADLTQKEFARFSKALEV